MQMIIYDTTALFLGGNLLLGITPSGVSVLGVGLMGALRSHACVVSLFFEFLLKYLQAQ